MTPYQDGYDLVIENLDEIVRPDEKEKYLNGVFHACLDALYGTGEGRETLLKALISNALITLNTPTEVHYDS